MNILTRISIKTTDARGKLCVYVFDSLYSFAAPYLDSSKFGFTKRKPTLVQIVGYSDEIYNNVQKNDIYVET